MENMFRPITKAASSPAILNGGTPTVQTILQKSKCTLPFLRSFFKSWLKLDINQLASVLAIVGTLSSAAKVFRGLWGKIYWSCVKNFTSSISISSNDKLNAEILDWVGINVLDRRDPRILTAQSEVIYGWWRRYQPERRAGKNGKDDKKIPVRYLPTFGATWFFHKRALFIIRLVHGNTSRGLKNETPDEYSSAPSGDEPLLLMCFGRSAKPIKDFIETCRDFAKEQRDNCVSVMGAKSSKDGTQWGRRILKPMRPMDTVHFDEKVKTDLVEDIERYLSWETKEFYRTRGIPYRRGYIFHGPPGTGKTSLSLALAGRLELDLFQLHLPSIIDDTALEALFASLPRRCLVILEDIDAVGAARTKSMTGLPEVKELDGGEGDCDEKTGYEGPPKTSNCTLSGLLNVLDGVASQEGRVLIMTSNVPNALDKALIRPGRIDKMVYLGYISKDSARHMFLRMYLSDDHEEPQDSEKSVNKELERLSLEFSNKFPENIFTPAQVQGFMLTHRGSPTKALDAADAWIAEQLERREKIRQRKEQIVVEKAKN